MQRVLNTLADTTQVAQELVQKWQKGAIVALSGPLGAGKTTLVRAIIQQIAHNNGKKLPRVPSPTYVIHQCYPELNPAVDHFDWYRLEKIDENALITMGFFEVLEKAQLTNGLVLVEWPERSLAQSFFTQQIEIKLDSKGLRTLEGQF